MTANDWWMVIAIAFVTLAIFGLLLSIAKRQGR